MFKNINLNIQSYLQSSPNFNKIDWKDLPDSIKLQLDTFPSEIKKLGNFVTVERLKQIKRNITNNIVSIKRKMTGNESFKIKLPIFLKNKHYARLYALMSSEGSYRTEFSLHVPEKEFHKIFKDCIKNLISKEATNLIKCRHNKGFLRSRAPSIIRHLVPIPPQIPSIIMNNKNLAKEYLKIAFEAEGSPIYNKKGHKRYIKLSRYTDITPFISKEELPLTKRIYLSDLKKEYPGLFEKIRDIPPKILQGEQILLKYHFDIDSKLQLEAIRKNKTDLRCGKITARWVLLIYANNINNFIENIGFISKKKKIICEKMMEMPSQRQQYFALEIINSVQKNGSFTTKDFCKEMKKLGYKSPHAYIWRYKNKGLIKRVSIGRYNLIY